MPLTGKLKARWEKIFNGIKQVRKIKIPYFRLVTLLLVIYLAWLTVPGIQLSAITPGLDPSWMYAINFIPGSDYVFGQDVVWTYGPLGYLMYPEDIGQNALMATIFWNGLYLLVYGILIYLVFKRKRTLPIFLFIAALIAAWLLMSVSLAGIFHAKYFVFLLLLGLLLGITALDKIKLGYIPVILAGGLSGLAIFMKINLGLSATIMIAIFTVYWWITNRQQSGKTIIAVWAGFLFSIIVVTAIYFHTPGNLAHWIRGSIDLMTGYSAAMSYGTTQKQLLMIALLVMALFWILALFFLKNRSKAIFISLLLTIPVFFAFKEGFVRQDYGHILHFFLFIPVAISVLFLFGKDKKDLLWIFHIFIFTAVITTLVVFIINTKALNQSYRSAVSGMISNGTTVMEGKAGWTNIKSLVHFKQIREQINTQSQRNLEQDRLPAEWVDTIGKSTVDAVPTEICYMPANNLNWNPDPVFQIYAEFTSYLDNWSAEHYTGEKSPQFLIAAFDNTDGRHPLESAPAAWRTIINNYEVIDYDPQVNRFLLEKKPASEVNNDLANGQRTEGKVKQWIEVPPSNNLLYAEIKMHTTLKGKLASTFYLIPPVNIDLVYTSGKVLSWRIVPDTLADGILVNYLPSNGDELDKTFAGRADDRVQKFEISGPGINYYDNNLDITWRESAYPISYSNQAIEEINPQNLAQMTGSTLCNIDTLNNLQTYNQDGMPVIDTRETGIITATGWAVDEPAGQAAGGVFINIDGQRDMPAAYGLDRWDVAQARNQSNYRFSGFSGACDTSILSKGQHTLALKIVTADKKGYYLTSGIKIEVR
jgi:hypothetical protein